MGQNDQDLLLCPEPSYWSQTFLSTAGTAVPIFLQPWGGGPPKIAPEKATNHNKPKIFKNDPPEPL